MNLCDFLLPSTENDALPALIDAEDRIITYNHLRCTVAHLAGFIEQVTTPQDRCLIVAGGGLFWVASYLAIIKAGRIAVPVPSEGPADHLERIARGCVPSLAFVASAHMPMLARLVRPGMAVVTDGPVHRTNAIACAEALAYPPMNRSRPTSSDMLASLTYTTSPSDELHGTMVTHGNIIASVNALLQCLALRCTDRTLCMAPLPSCLGTSLLHIHLRAGATLVLRGPSHLVLSMPEALDRHRCTILAGTAPNYQLLLQQPDLATRSLPHLRALHLGGGRIRRPLLERLRRVFHDRPITVLHGQAEATGPFACLRPDKLERKPAAIGQGIANTTLTVVDPAGQPALPGEVGQLIVHGPTVALGYWRDPASSRRVFHGGQLHTGELARMDRDGDVYLVGQTQDLGNANGFPPLQCPVREVHYAALNFGLSEDSNATRLPFYWEEDDLREPKDHPR